MSIKLCEALFLRRQEKKLLHTEKRRRKEYADLLKQQLNLRNGSEGYNSMQSRAALTQDRVRVILHAHQLLPKVIGDVDKAYRDLKQRLKLVLELKEEIEALQYLGDECEKLKERRRGELRRFNARIEGTSMMMFESLKKEYKNLLAAPVKVTGIKGSIAT
ncbi:hypothetical protein BGZ60DRAFT_437430 [Tricladium varicosporioides]|nr:hypothetical protein BGZ60DRAFT_437430 [Hymenoscyphus varicosporioides]